MGRRGPDASNIEVQEAKGPRSSICLVGMAETLNRPKVVLNRILRGELGECPQRISSECLSPYTTR